MEQSFVDIVTRTVPVILICIFGKEFLKKVTIRIK
jgi:hypothetical protein